MTLAWTRSELQNKGLEHMAGSGKKKTTMAKLTRESRLRERRLDKAAKKDARKLAPAHDPYSPGDTPNATSSESEQTGSVPAGLEPDIQTRPGT
jgi:hypothetical protein